MSEQLNIFDELQKGQSLRDELRLQAALRHSTGRPTPIDEARNRVALQQQGRVLAERGRITALAAGKESIAGELPDAITARGVSSVRSMGALQGPQQRIVPPAEPGFYIPEHRTPVTGPPMARTLRRRSNAHEAFKNFDPEANLLAKRMSEVNTQQPSFSFMRQDLANNFSRQNASQLAAGKTAARFGLFGEELDELSNKIAIDRGTKHVMGRTGYHRAGAQGIITGTRDRVAGTAGVLFKALYPEKYNQLANSVLDANDGDMRAKMIGASITADEGALNAIRKTFNASMARGPNKTSLSMGSRLILNVNKSVMSSVGKAAGTGALGAARGANTISKVALGASLGQVGFAAAVVGGIGLAAGNALGVTGPQAAQAASAVHESFKQANKPVYGRSELGQSTQGLLFGLNSRRTR